MRRVAIALTVLALSACGRNDAPAHMPADESAAACAAAVDGPIGVADAWVRAATAGQPTSAVYLTLCNTAADADRLIGVSTGAANAAEIHETRKDASGVTRMNAIDGLDLEPLTPVSLAPGGAHIMLIGLTDSIAEDETITLTLQFERAAPVTIEAPARGLVAGARDDRE